MTTESVEEIVAEYLLALMAPGHSIQDCGAVYARQIRDKAVSLIAALTERGYAIEQGWRDIGSAPKDGTKILALCQPTFFETGKDMPFNYVNVVWWTQRTRYRGDSEADTWGWRHTLTNSNAQPTHWKPIGPLPAAPGGSDGR